MADFIPDVSDIAGILHTPEGTAEEVMDIDPGKPAPAPSRPRGRPRKAQPVPGAKPNSTAGQTGRPVKMAKPEVPMPPKGEIAKGVAQIYVYAGMGLSTIRPQTGMALAGEAENLGKAWEAAAVSNPAIRRAILSMMQTSTVGILVAAHLPVVLVAIGEGKEIKANAAAAKAESEPGTFAGLAASHA